MGLVKALALFLRAFVVSRAALAAENLALRQQLSVLAHTVKRPKCSISQLVHRLQGLSRRQSR